MVTNDDKMAIDRADLLGLFELQPDVYEGYPVWKKNMSIRFIYRRKSSENKYPNSWCISPHKFPGNPVVISIDTNVESIFGFIGSSLTWNYFDSGSRHDTNLTLTEVFDGKFEILRFQNCFLSQRSLVIVMLPLLEGK